MTQEMILTSQDFNHFRKWLNLNLDGLTWQGRFKKEFEVFWDVFFQDEISLSELMSRFDYAYSEVKIGSLSSWFLWLKNKFLSYIFINKGISIKAIALQSGMSSPVVATELRNFFLDEHPHLDQYFNSAFQVGSVLSPNLGRTFKSIQDEISIIPPVQGARDDEIMSSMEVTLFDEWSSFTKKMSKDFSGKKLDLFKIKEKNKFLSQVKILQDVSILLLLFTLTVYSVKKVNFIYERYLINKVSIYEPQFNWLNKDVLFKGVERSPVKEFKLNFDDIKDISKGDEITEFFDPEKYEEESEVTLTNFENIPRDLNKADKEASQYEGDAENPNGYRETRGGTTKIYRLMMTSTNTYASRDKINELIKKYNGSPVGGSRPGSDVPGGVYYNVYIPRSDFKDFIKETMEVNKGKLFESNTSNVKNVPGKTRVFIMIKSI